MRHMDQWDRNESSGMNSHIYSLSIFNGEPRQFSGGKNSLFSTQAWTTGYPHKLGQLAIHTNKRMKLEPFPSSIYKRSRCTTDPNTRLEAGKGQTMGPIAREHWKSQRQGPGPHTDGCGPLPPRSRSPHRRLWSFASDFWGWQVSVTDAGVTPLRQKVPGKHFPSALQFISFESQWE